MSLDDELGATIDRMNAIVKRAGPRFLDSWRDIREYRGEIKQVLRLHRDMIETEPRDDIRHIHRQQLRCMKRLHYNLVQLEQLAVARASETN